MSAIPATKFYVFELQVALAPNPLDIALVLTAYTRHSSEETSLEAFQYRTLPVHIFLSSSQRKPE